MHSYYDLAFNVLNDGEQVFNRTDKPTKTLKNQVINLEENSDEPIVTKKFVPFKTCMHELIWMLNGETNIKYLNDNNVHIWDEWADENGELGPVYGAQWRNFNGVDQLDYLLKEITNQHNSRRLVLCTWNPKDLSKMALPPCPVLFQLHIETNMNRDYKAYFSVYQRSADIFLGLPFDMLSYQMLFKGLVKTIAKKLNRKIIEKGGAFFIGDAHIYFNHIEQVKKMLNNPSHTGAELIYKGENILKPKIEDFELKNYKHSGIIKGEVAV